VEVREDFLSGQNTMQSFLVKDVGIQMSEVLWPRVEVQMTFT
jgi:hypothetical protein